ncbi:MAG TPA: ABC transporter permease [Micromonosporaceae bacterium]|nr:ABC transporter permease [Micromonosporaceae bacterium]
MTEVVTAAPVAHTQPLRVRHFVRLKLRILANAMRGSGQRVLLFILGVLAGLWAAVTGFGILAAGSASGDADARLLVTALFGTFLTVSWVLVPLLFFGVDETLDPARFALLPIPPRRLAAGMLAAACVGIPPVATLLATLGLTVGAVLRGGPGAVVVAVLGALLGLVLCVVASRAVTSAFAGMLRSRKVRDLAIILIAVLASSIGPGQLLLGSMLQGGSISAGTALARVLGWTPLAAPFVAVTDAINGQWGYAAARLAIGVASIGLLLLWWSRTLESAMVGTASAASAPSRTATRGTLVAALIPGPLRRLPATPLVAIIARECRYWWREPRRRAGMVSLLMAAVAVPIATRLSFGGSDPGSQGLSLTISLTIAGVVVAMVVANQFGTDGTQYGTHLLAGVPGRTDLRGRAGAIALLSVPVLILVAVGVAVVTDGLGELVPALGGLLGGFGVSLAVASLVSVLVPYPVPESTNPFAVSSGGTSAKSLLTLLGLVAAGALITPVLLAYFQLPAHLVWLVLPLGAVWGTGAVLLGTYIAGDALDRRGPEVLSAVTPRR